MHLWRISNHLDLSGEGGLRRSARWHTRGSRVVYLADSSAGALLEVLAHLEIVPTAIPEHYSLLRVSVPDTIEIEQLTLQNGKAWSDGKAWKDAVGITRQLGDTWLKSEKTALARVPSAIVSHSWNYLLNPGHPHAERIQIDEVIREHFDSRLFRF